MSHVLLLTRHFEHAINQKNPLREIAIETKTVRKWKPKKSI